MQEKKELIEAALFVAAKPLDLEQIKKIVDMPEKDIKTVLDGMKREYDDHGIKVIEHNGLFELQIKDQYLKKVEHLAPGRDFSRGVLQTLSLIAYKQPLKQSEVVKIRGNRAYEHVKSLVKRGLIKKEPKGHTSILHITKKFLEYFGLENSKQLKAYFAEKPKE